MMMTAPPPPPITYPALRKHATISSQHSGRGGGKLAAGSVQSGYTPPPSSMAGSAYSDLLSLNNPVGSIAPQQAVLSSSTRQRERSNLGFSSPLMPMMKQSRFVPGTAAVPQPQNPSSSSASEYQNRLSLASEIYSPPPPSGPFTGAAPAAMSGSLMAHNMSQRAVRKPLLKEHSKRAAPPPPAPAPSGPFSMFGSFGSMAKKTARPAAVFESQQEHVLPQHRSRASTSKVKDFSFIFAD
jgi:hypothetical protein